MVYQSKYTNRKANECGRTNIDRNGNGTNATQNETGKEIMAIGSLAIHAGKSLCWFLLKEKVIFARAAAFPRSTKP